MIIRIEVQATKGVFVAKEYRDLTVFIQGFDDLAIVSDKDADYRERNTALELLVAAGTSNAIFGFLLGLRRFALRRGLMLSISSPIAGTTDLAGTTDQHLADLSAAIQSEV